MRTLWPRISPTSNTSRNSRSASGATRAAAAAAVQDHQVHVAVGGHVAAAVTAVGHQGDFGEQPVGAGLAQVGQRRVDQFQEHGVAEIGGQRETSIAGAAGLMATLEVLVALGQPRLAASTLERSRDTAVDRGARDYGLNAEH